jgi:lipoprotein-anchoring transpeptidase ErfK/SrfK
MCKFKLRHVGYLLLAVSPLLLNACATSHSYQSGSTFYYADNYDTRIPQKINTTEKVVVVDPTVHTWGAYDSHGNLVKAGIATAGGSWCPDINSSCRTSTGTFRIQSLGDGGCYSKKYPLPRGGGLMPYCMYFNNGQALHGSPDGTVIEDNVSHGCVRMRIADAEWMRYNFATVGTKVIVKPY